MPQTDGPWGRKPNPVATGGQYRFYIWIAVVLAGALGLWKLSTLFPAALSSSWDQVQFLNLIGILLIVSSGLILGRRFRSRDTIRNIAIWCAVFAVLGIGYTFRNELSAVGERVRGELIPSYAGRARNVADGE